MQAAQNGAAYLADVMTFASKGHPVFPVRNKKPLVEWTKAATTDEGVINAWWRQYQHPAFAWAIPADVLIIDVDDPDAFKATGLPLPETAHQPTAVEGHSHHVYTIPEGTAITQRAKIVPGADYRVGGKGYVVLYEPRMLLAKWAPAPEWPVVLEAAAGENVVPFPVRKSAGQLGTRDEILFELGTIASQGRGRNLHFYAGILAGLRAQGVIVDLDPARPWSDEDLLQLAKEAEDWDQKAEADKQWSDAQIKKLEASIARGKEPDVLSQGDLVSLDQMARVDPPPLLNERWDPTGASILYGTGGVGKGRLAAQEVAWMVRSNPDLRVLIVDYEDHPQEWRGRIEDCGGDLERISWVAPHSPQWKGEPGSIEKHAPRLRSMVEAGGFNYLVIDSAMVAVPGFDVGDPRAPQIWATALQHIGLPSLTLAHVTKEDADPAYPFGSIFWHNLARITWSLAYKGEDRLILRARKHNNYPQLANLGKYVLEVPEGSDERGRIHVTSGFWTLTPQSVDTQNRIEEILVDHPTGLTTEELSRALKDDYDVAIKPDTLARWLRRRYQEGYRSSGEKPARWTWVEPRD